MNAVKLNRAPTFKINLKFFLMKFNFTTDAKYTADDFRIKFSLNR